MSSIEILKRLYRDYTKKYFKNIFLSLFFSIILAGRLQQWLILDPAIKQLFIEQKQSLIYIIPDFIIAFLSKGLSLISLR